MEHKNERLAKVYNGNIKIMEAGFTMLSNYINPLLARMVDEKILTPSAQTIIPVILSYKHTENNPFPSREELGRLLDKSVKAIGNALKAVTDSGILAIKKVGRKNTYDFTPLFDLLEKFIIEMVDKKNYKVKIADLMKVKVVKKKKSTTDFDEVKKKASEKELVPAEGEEVPVESVEEEKEPEVVLPEEIKKVILAYGIDEAGQEAIGQAYSAYGEHLDVKVFIDKIVASAMKKDFVNYFMKCITNAYKNDEQPQETPVQKQKEGFAPNGRKIVRKEVVPMWLGDKEEQKEAKKENLSYEELIEQAETLEDLKEVEEGIKLMFALSPDSKHGNVLKPLYLTKKSDILGYKAEDIFVKDGVQ